MPSVAILGASGYAGQETLDRALGHPELEVVALGSDSLAGESASALDVRLNGSLPRFVSNDEAASAGADLLLLCLDHDRAAAFQPPAGSVVVDLSGAHRLRDTSLYKDWYGWEHPGSTAGGSHGLPQLFPPQSTPLADPRLHPAAASPAPPPGQDPRPPG